MREVGAKEVPGAKNSQMMGRRYKSTDLVDATYFAFCASLSGKSTDFFQKVGDLEIGMGATDAPMYARFIQYIAKAANSKQNGGTNHRRKTRRKKKQSVL